MDKKTNETDLHVKGLKDFLRTESEGQKGGRVHKFVARAGSYRYDVPATDEDEFAAFERYMKEKLSPNGASYTFAAAVESFIDKKKLKPRAVQDAGGLSRQDYSRLTNRLHPVRPTKVTAWKFAIGLRLDYEETVALFKSAGYVPDNATKLDLTFTYAVMHGIYSLERVNELLRRIGEEEVPNRGNAGTCLD